MTCAKKTVLRVAWVPHSDGGRAAPPTGPRYSTVARFENQEQWSLVLEWTGQDIMAWFLSDKAPQRLLESGMKFDLQEGNRIVAHGEVA